MKPKRPSVINFAKDLFWIYSIGVLATQYFGTWRIYEIVDYPSICIGLLVLVAAISLSPSLTTRRSYFLGVVALFSISLRTLMTAKTQYGIIDLYPHMPGTVIGTSVLSILFIILTWQFAKTYEAFPENSE